MTAAGIIATVISAPTITIAIVCGTISTTPVNARRRTARCVVLISTTRKIATGEVNVQTTVETIITNANGTMICADAVVLIIVTIWIGITATDSIASKADRMDRAAHGIRGTDAIANDPNTTTKPSPIISPT